MDDSNVYTDIEWALTLEAKELRDVLTALGMEQDLAMATLERLLPDNILYKVENG